MHYYQHHIGDFIKDTSYLTNEEIGIYMKLIWLYYDTEQPLQNNMKVLLMKLNSRDKLDEVVNILHLFFDFDEEEEIWRHSRCDNEIAEYQAFCAKQKANGLKGGRPKVTQKEPKNNPTVSQDEAKITLTTNHKPLTINQYTDEFEIFWKAYDKPAGKANAFKIWKSLKIDKPLMPVILQKATIQARSVERKFRKDAERWLKDRRWEDEISDVQQVEKVRFL